MGQYSAFIKGTALAAATAKSVIQIATPANVRARITEWSISFDGTNAAAVPVAVDVMRATTVCTGTAFTPLLLDPTDHVALVTAKTAATVEGTPSDVLATYALTPNGGLYTEQYPLGREMLMNASGFFQLRCTAPAVVNATAYIYWEEF